MQPPDPTTSPRPRDPQPDAPVPAGGYLLPPDNPLRRSLSPTGLPARHPWEIPLLVVVIVLTVLGYVTALITLASGYANEIVLLFALAPILIWFVRGRTWGSPRVNGIKISPTQFPQAHRMVVDAAARFGMAKVPDAYVVLGNGQINAFASGHGFRRFVVVYSDLFEIGGEAREPDALAFIIGHEVGHVAAGHTSYWRQLGTFAMGYLPFVGSGLSRAQEYTADNYGYAYRAQGSGRAMCTLGAGKYLNVAVGYDELADRAFTERGFFPWLVNALASHPVLTWRSQALRDRSRHGRLLLPPTPPTPTQHAPTQP